MEPKALPHSLGQYQDNYWVKTIQPKWNALKDQTISTLVVKPDGNSEKISAFLTLSSGVKLLVTMTEVYPKRCIYSNWHIKRVNEIGKKLQEYNAETFVLMPSTL